MLDHCSNLFSFNPNHQITDRDEDFTFWGGQYYEKFNGDQEFDDSSNYPLLGSRLQVIAEARKELMKRVHDMPESNYELSLKDIVDEQPALEENGTDGKGSSSRVDETETPVKTKTKKVKQTDKNSKILRSGSMEKENFMIKMFVPTSFSWKIKIRRNGSNVSASSKLHGSDREWGIKSFVDSEGGKTSKWSHGGGGGGVGRSSSCILRSWRSICKAKGIRRNKGHRGCFF